MALNHRTTYIKSKRHNSNNKFYQNYKLEFKESIKKQYSDYNIDAEHYSEYIINSEHQFDMATGSAAPPAGSRAWRLCEWRTDGEGRRVRKKAVKIIGFPVFVC